MVRFVSILPVLAISNDLLSGPRDSQPIWTRHIYPLNLTIEDRKCSCFSWGQAAWSPGDNRYRFVCVLRHDGHRQAWPMRLNGLWRGKHARRGAEASGAALRRFWGKRP